MICDHGLDLDTSGPDGAFQPTSSIHTENNGLLSLCVRDQSLSPCVSLRCESPVCYHAIPSYTKYYRWSWMGCGEVSRIRPYPSRCDFHHVSRSAGFDYTQCCAANHTMDGSPSPNATWCPLRLRWYFKSASVVSLVRWMSRMGGKIVPIRFLYSHRWLGEEG